MLGINEPSYWRTIVQQIKLTLLLRYLLSIDEAMALFVAIIGT